MWLVKAKSALEITLSRDIHKNRELIPYTGDGKIKNHRSVIATEGMVSRKALDER